MTDLQKKHDKLLKQARGTISLTAGCGSRGQRFVDAIFEQLNDVRKQMGLEVLLIPTCRDDGQFGAVGGITLGNLENFVKRG